MTSDVSTSFLTYYLRSLAERTRVEKTGTKFGFDWVIYNIGLSENWSPSRLPFTRGGGDEISKTKTENEFGIDFAFLSADRSELIVFVLKDEVLNSRNWGKHSFDIDLRKAAIPDLTSVEMTDVTMVRVILAYNKDEDQPGLKLFRQLVENQPPELRGHVKLAFERWNLTNLVEKVRDNLLTPSLLPQKFFSQFSYLCSQFGDFQHGSDEWEHQLIPNWRRFLSELFGDKPDERSVRLLPVALIVLREHGKTNRSAETGWIDLVEWGTLAAWEVFRTSDRKPVREAVAQIWFEFYLVELDRYYAANAELLAVEYGMEKHRFGGFIDAVASAVVAHWHIARLGIFAVALAELLPDASDTERQRKGEMFAVVSAWLYSLVKASPSAKRPLLDIHHIQLFLVWRTLWQISRHEDLCDWMMELQNRLATRRFGKGEIPFLNGNNSLELVFEFAATRVRPHDYCERSSIFLTCLLELCFSLPDDVRDTLAGLVYRRLVLGQTDDGHPVDGCKPIDLMLWLPPADWQERLLTKNLAEDGECVTIRLFAFGGERCDADVIGALRKFVEVTRRERPFNWDSEIPMAVVILACLRHGTPLPPELWRQPIFGEESQV